MVGFETSCDETGVGIVRGHTLLAHAVASSVDSHARFGGVMVPEVAVAGAPGGDGADRAPGVLRRRGAAGGRGRRRGDGRTRPVRRAAGRVAAAKAYAPALGKPLYGVDHLAAHVAVGTLEHGPLPEPAVALPVSGGHSSLLLVPDLAEEVEPLGATIDDAAGEAFDKVARLLGCRSRAARRSTGPRAPVRRTPCGSRAG